MTHKYNFYISQGSVETLLGEAKNDIGLLANVFGITGTELYND